MRISQVLGTGPKLLGLLAMSIVLVHASADPRQDIKVRVISAKTGRPLVEAHVQLFIGDKPKPGERSWEPLFDRWEYTDGTGTAVFHVSSPIPLTAGISVGGAGADWCSPARYKASDVLRSGVSEPGFGSCPHRPLKKFVLKPHPGEIIIYMGEYSRWERALYFPWAS